MKVNEFIKELEAVNEKFNDENKFNIHVNDKYNLHVLEIKSYDKNKYDNYKFFISLGLDFEFIMIDFKEMNNDLLELMEIITEFRNTKIEDRKLEELKYD